MESSKCTPSCAACENARQTEVLPGGRMGMPLDQTRRSLLSWLLGGGVAASLASFFYPVVRFLNPPYISETSVNEVAAGKVQDLKPNSGKIVKFGNKPGPAGARG